jgi:hypothetical protein
MSDNDGIFCADRVYEVSFKLPGGLSLGQSTHKISRKRCSVIQNPVKNSLLASSENDIE